MFRTAIARQARLFSTSPIARKSPVEVVKDAAKVVDRTISDAAVKGIETGEQAAKVVQDKLPNSTAEAKGQASEVAGQASGKASELAGQAQGKASEVSGKTSGKASELAGKAEGKAQEAKGQAKAKTY